MDSLGCWFHAFDTWIHIVGTVYKETATCNIAHVCKISIIRR